MNCASPRGIFAGSPWPEERSFRDANVNVRALADSLRGEINADGSVATIDSRDGGWRDQDSAPAQPSSGFYDQIPHDPRPIFEIEFARRPHCSIEREDVTPLQARHEFEHADSSIANASRSIDHGLGKFRLISG